MSDESAGSAMSEKDIRMWLMGLHLSQLAGFIIPFAGLIAPIAIWQLKKNEIPGMDEHGKMIANWIISAVIYAVVSSILMIIIIGIFGLIAVAIASIAFPIIGGIKANKGEFWQYPLSLKLLK